MTHEDFLEAENKRCIERDKVYKSHLKKVETLTERQVKAQEAMVQKLTQFMRIEGARNARISSKTK